MAWVTPRPPPESTAMSVLPPTFRIGELSARTGRGIHAIRWYESLGLMPGVTRDAAGRRVYNERHVDWLVLIDRLRHTGMSIAQMREYTALVRQGRSTLKQRQALLAAHRARVEQTIAEWTQALGLLDTKIDFYGEWLATGKRPPLTGLLPPAPAVPAPRRRAVR
jgi:DNA-binding transcriptional MerR regulator